MHCGDLSGKEIQKEEDMFIYIYIYIYIYIHMADSFLCMVETNNYASIKINFKKSNISSLTI